MHVGLLTDVVIDKAVEGQCPGGGAAPAAII